MFVQRERLLFITLIIVSAVLFTLIYARVMPESALLLWICLILVYGLFTLLFYTGNVTEKAVKQEIKSVNISLSGDRVDISLRKPFKTTIGRITNKKWLNYHTLILSDVSSETTQRISIHLDGGTAAVVEMYGTYVAIVVYGEKLVFTYAMPLSNPWNDQKVYDLGPALYVQLISTKN